MTRSTLPLLSAARMGSLFSHLRLRQCIMGKAGAADSAGQLRNTVWATLIRRPAGGAPDLRAPKPNAARRLECSCCLLFQECKWAHSHVIKARLLSPYCHLLAFWSTETHPAPVAHGGNLGAAV